MNSRSQQYLLLYEYCLSSYLLVYIYVCFAQTAKDILVSVCFVIDVFSPFFFRLDHLHVHVLFIVNNFPN